MTNSDKTRRRLKPKYQLIHADSFMWLESRRAKSVHAVVTDPPYGLVEYQADQLEKRANGKGGIWRLPQAYDGHSRRPMPRFTVLGPKERVDIQRFHDKLAKALLRVLVPGGHVFIASHTLLSHLVIPGFTTNGFELRGQVARTVSTLRGGDRPKFAHEEYADLSVIPRSAWEPWLIFRKPCEGLVRDNLEKWKTGALRRPAKNNPFRDFIESSPARNPERAFADHPSLKPQAFMRQIVRASLPLGKGVLLDPFVGSGATLAAAEVVGVRSIGIEINKKYYKMAQKAIPMLAAVNNGHPGPASKETMHTSRTSSRRRSQSSS